MKTRRDLLQFGVGAAALSALPFSIQRALAAPASVQTGTIKDVRHIVVLMQENRSFDHYFGALRGVRGFGDRFPIPLGSGKPVWHQFDGTREIPPYHLEKDTMNAALIPSSPHDFSDAQMAWNHGAWWRFHPSGARRTDFQSRGLGWDRLFPDLRRERWFIRSHTATSRSFL